MFACRVPHCTTNYWDKSKKQTMFKAPSQKQLSDWQVILRNKGVHDFGKDHRICILHFEENDIERDRVTHQSGGIVARQPRKVPLLSYTAVPTIFPPLKPATMTQQQKPKTRPYAHLEQIPELDPITFVEQSAVLKRKRSNDDAVCSHNFRSANQLKTSDLFQLISDMIHNEKRVSLSLSKLWIPNIIDNKCIRWSLWKANRLIEEKSINLYADLKVEVFVEQKKIVIPQANNVVEMSDLENVFLQVSEMLPCKVADYQLKEDEDLCLGFVLKNVGRQRIWCAPCSKYQKNLKRRVATTVKTRNLKTAKQSLHVQCNKLRHKSQLLKSQLKVLKKNVRSLKKQCKNADKVALDKAIRNLTPSEQAGVQACFAASRIKDMRGMRYTTQWVYECLLLRIKSRKAYEHLRRRRILVLPDVSTLNRYIKRIRGCYGFQSSLFELLAEKTEKMKPDEVRGTLLIDEMKLTKTLSFNRQNLKVEGFTDLGNYTPKHQRGKKGDHALVFMFQPWKGKWVQSLGCFLSKGSATGTVLHQLIIECVALTEKSGLRIDAIATDGASWNRNMWKIFGVKKECVSVPHIVDPCRRLWFISDFPHLIKCMRNFFTHKGRARNAGIWTPDGIVSLLHWYALLKVEDETSFNLKVNFKLRKEHLDPEFYKKMNVALAFQFFGLADAMELFKDQHSDLANCEPSINFSRRVKLLLTAMNSRTPVNNLKPGNDMWKVIEEFINYLDKWEAEAKQRGHDFLPDPTCYGLQISLRAALEIYKFLVDECGFRYLMTARLNQDNLERFFGMLRDCCGSNEHPDSSLFIQMYRLVTTYSLVKPPKGSNISGGEILDVLINLKDVTDADERWEQWNAQIDTIIDKGIRCDQLTDAANLLEDHDYFGCSTSDYVIAYVSGFVARKASRFVINDSRKTCEECTCSLLLDPAQKIPESHKLINLKSYGYLKHPSQTLFDLISLLEHGTLKAIREKDVNAQTLFDVTDAVEQLSAPPLIGCTGHANLLTHRVITFYLTTRMYFLCKQANKNDSVERENTRKKRKLSKLTNAPDVQHVSYENRARVEVPQNCKTLKVDIAKKPGRKFKLKDLTRSTAPKMMRNNTQPSCSIKVASMDVENNENLYRNVCKD